jgi:hypothetical protein
MPLDAHFELRHNTFSTAIFCPKTKKSHAKTNREWTRIENANGRETQSTPTADESTSARPTPRQVQIYADNFSSRFDHSITPSLHHSIHDVHSVHLCPQLAFPRRLDFSLSGFHPHEHQHHHVRGN